LRLGIFSGRVHLDSQRRQIMLDTLKRPHAAALFFVSSLAGIAPQASAQALQSEGGPLPGALVVKITDPPSGSAVANTVPVAASVGAAESPVIVGVQFQLDGADFGAEDTSPPYAVSWDTTATAEGWHTLSAIARDANGLQFASDPVTVTVANAPPPATAATRHEESDPAVSYSLGWTQSNGAWFGWSGGRAVESMIPGARVTFSFAGTSVTWIGYRSGRSGIARVYVDGVLVSEVDLFARTDEVHSPVYTAKGLTNSNHTLTIEVTGLMNPEAISNLIVIDAFDVPGPAVSHLQDTDPDIAYSAGWSPADASTAWSGGSATASAIAGAQAILTFNGTSIAWNGYRGPDAGTARVFLDGVFAGDVDMYAPTHSVQGNVFTASGLADSSHMLTIEATGERNAASSGALVVVDSLDVTRPGTRFQETDWAVTYTGAWTQGNRNRTWSEGTAAVSSSAGAQAIFTFRGTSASWIGFRAARTGIARIYVDDMFVAEVDTYAPTEGFQDTIYTVAGLATGSHTLTIEATGQKNPAATNNYVVVDAFDVRQ
jgi:hypothetical protein